MVYVFLADGFEEIEALTPVDLLRRAGVAVTTLGVGGKREIKGAHGITVLADAPDTDFADEAPTMVVLPGGMPGASNLDASPAVAAALSKAAACGGFLAAICAAPMVLGHKGYLAGKTATCYPGFESELKGARAKRAPVVRDGNVITGAGMGVAAEFALALVEALCGRDKAAALAKGILKA